MPLSEASPTTLGVTLEEGGGRFALACEAAEAVELCLLDVAGFEVNERRLPLTRISHGMWICRVSGVTAGQRYGYRVHGPYDPRLGLRFNSSKLLLDPYALAVSGELRWSDAIYGYHRGGSDDLTRSALDSAASVPHSLIAERAFDWTGDVAPRRSWTETVLYEAHVKGVTALHSDVPVELRGTYLGLSQPAVLDHFQQLGVTAIELLPVHHSISQRPLVDRGLVNYWGYDPIAFFAPDRRFATRDGDPVVEFKTMVRELHRAGLEVIVDVVFNHTAETDRYGPTLSMRGIDNRLYYRLMPHDLATYENHSGCGNSLNTDHPVVQRLVLDCLRYWVTDMHVDGFRFDLAASLGRTAECFEPDHPMLQAIENDPVLSRVKLIAEPWDVGPFGHLTGRFGPAWSEWNDRFRNDARRFWRGDPGMVPGVATRFAGSSDLFSHKRRKCQAGVNFVTSHDGFTLSDLVSYEGKHNEANGEANTDGANDNHSRNWGCEGVTGDATIVVQRDRIRRALMATLAFSRGVPMILHGDECGRSQRGNNNAYCQDNEISWMTWEWGAEERRFLDFVRRCLAVRRAHPALLHDSFLEGEVNCGCGIKDVTWLTASGEEMASGEWHDAGRRLLCALMHVHAPATTLSTRTPAVAEITDPADTILIAANADGADVTLRLPSFPAKGLWSLELDTAGSSGGSNEAVRGEVVAPRHSLLLLSWTRLGR